MKKGLALLLALMIIVSLGACATDPAPPAGGTPAAPAETPDADPPGGSRRVAGIVFQDDQFMRLLQLGYREAAEAAGFEFFPGNTNGDVGQEVELLNTFVEQGFSGVAISPISEIASLAPLNSAAEAGLAISLSNTEIDEPWVIAVFTSDNFNLGYMTGLAAAEFVRNEMDGVANIGILQYRSLLPEQSGARFDGFMSALEGIEGITVVSDQDAWLQDVAITTAGDMLTANPNINLLWAANEGGTVGATMAVRNAGLAGEVFVFGTDASEQTIALLQADDNILQAVTGQDPYGIGFATMQALIAEIEGTITNRGEVVIVPGVVLSRADQALIEEFRLELLERMG